MKELVDILLKLKETNAPNLLIIAGLIFIFLSFVGKIGAIVELPAHRQKILGILGAVLLVLGIVIVVTTPNSGSSQASTPIAIQPTSAPELIPTTLAPSMVSAVSTPSPVSLDASARLPTVIPNYLLIDRFDNDTATTWYSLTSRGTAEVKDGRLILSGNDTILRVAGEEYWTNYIFKIKAQVIRGNDYGIIFRQADGCKLYMLQLFERDNEYNLVRFGGGNECFREDKDNFGGDYYKVYPVRYNGSFVSKDIRIIQGQEHEIEIHVLGDAVTCYFDGQKLFAENQFILRNGRIGLRVQDSVVSFDDLEVLSLQ